MLRQITRNEYTQAWRDLHPVDQQVAPLNEYVLCETRSPVPVQPRSVTVVRVVDESIGLGNGKFVESKGVDLRLVFGGNLSLVHRVHLVAVGGKWKWILPSWRYRDYKADRCPTEPGDATPPQRRKENRAHCASASASSRRSSTGSRNSTSSSTIR